MKDRIRKILKEDEDLRWLMDHEPVSREEIKQMIPIPGFFSDEMIDLVHKSSLHRDEIKKLIILITKKIDREVTEGQDTAWSDGYNQGWAESDEGYDSGHRDGYNEGYDTGYDDGKEEGSDDARDRGYDEGYDDGKEEGYRTGYEEGKEDTYLKAFEEGREYQADLDNIDYEKQQDPYTRDYYEDEEGY